MRALVTGCAGFLGRHFVHELGTQGWRVEGVDLNPMIFPSCLDWNEYQILYSQGDLLDMFRLKAVGIYDLIVHAAAMEPNRVAIDNMPRSHIYNRLLDAAMFDWAIVTGQRRILYLSSCAALDEFPDDYGLAKLAGERMAECARMAGTPVTVVRPYSGYGSDQSTDFPFGAFIARAVGRSDPFAVWGHGYQVRDWIHVDDVVRGALAVVESGTEVSVSLCSGIPRTMMDTARLITKLAEYSPGFAFQVDAPTGPSRRVGDPTIMLKYYTPTVSLEGGIERALKDYPGRNWK